MASHYAAKVGQKLLHAQQLLELAADINVQGPKRQKHLALIEATVFHLVLARDFYIGELLDGQRLSFLGAMSIQDAAALALSENKVCPEIDELLALDQDRFSWVANLRAQEHKISSLALPASANSDENGIQQISITNLDSSVSELNLQSLKTWCLEFKELLGRQRAASSEW